mmetsp:Transcript_52220/g.120097  ORF Transcript_52220/g.120097 Transcript_52220/m.120097 type:complete len:280 (+) Transcript_52220:719-1558(+)
MPVTSPRSNGACASTSPQKGERLATRVGHCMGHAWHSRARSAAVETSLGLANGVLRREGLCRWPLRRSSFYHALHLLRGCGEGWQRADKHNSTRLTGAARRHLLIDHKDVARSSRLQVAQLGATRTNQPTKHTLFDEQLVAKVAWRRLCLGNALAHRGAGVGPIPCHACELSEQRRRHSEGRSGRRHRMRWHGALRHVLLWQVLLRHVPSWCLHLCSTHTHVWVDPAHGWPLSRRHWSRRKRGSDRCGGGSSEVDLQGEHRSDLCGRRRHLHRRADEHH